ncbi:transmembrane protein, putative (macronuclear) [Tetrahymena thermophila SB210]|uniref:Transmembrane protein, putative n=1 Tax=Tetrahymena thermophila (strain SB210) TaxID=312017 RepID=Q22MN6_TETTS|nr:transmembrane protein, putative [Tetrahymena thermophila SB210]EAR86626.2 transmembrane protein, putative [Tetrahymena thermophila SB210]|eukprot:XP_976984.2 transmembrane protein, putative [Tetrahymena thermophila SB210]
MILFNIEITQGSFTNLENTQTQQDINKLYSEADTILYQRVPTGVISIFNFNNAVIDNLVFMSCKAYFSPTLYFNQGQYLSISNSKFIANQSYERAGALIINNLLSSDILDSEFISNISQTSYGGAMIIYKSTINQIANCTFQKNKALSDSGGAIIIISSEVKVLKDNQFFQNQAAIGGAIRLIQCLPYFINKKRDYSILNTFTDNIATLYGKDLSYNPQGLAIIDPKNPNNLIYHNYTLYSQQSGSLINPTLKVVIIDEDRQPIKFPGYFNQKANSTTAQKQVIEDINVLNQYSLYQLSIMSNNNTALQLDGTKISNFDYEENAYIFDIIAIAKPLTQSQLTIQTTIPFDVIDFNVKKILQKTLSLTITVDFRSCIRGEIPTIQNQQFITCDKCPSGKYSIEEIIYSTTGQSEQQFSQYSCKICPQQAKFCEGDIIQLKNGYWRWGNYTDNIYYCSKYPQNCVPEDPHNKFGCQKGTIGVQCSECDLRGVIWGEKYGRLNTDECQDCKLASSWSNILILIVEIFIILLYQAYQINKQRIFALKQCAYKCLRITYFLIMGKSELIDQGSIYLKMYVNYAQIMVVFRSFQFNILPNFLFSIFSIFGGDQFSLSFLNTDCFISSLILSLPVYMNKFIYTLTYPLIFFVANAILRILFKTPQGLIISLKSPNYLTTIKYRPSVLEKQKQKQILYKMKQFVVNNLADLKSNFIFLYFFYAPTVIKTILSYMICQNVDDKFVLIGDQSQFCNINSQQFYLVTYIVPVFIVWIFLIPAGLLLILFLNRNFLSWMYMKRAYGYIYQEYRPSIYYWEFIKIYLKILIISSQIVLNKDIRLQQMYILSSLFLYLLVTKKVKPYSSTDMNQCDQNLTIVLIFNILIFCVSEQINSQILIKYIIQTLLFIVNISIIIFIAKHIFLKKFPYSYFKMNIFQKIIFKLCSRFPKLYRYIVFQPQDPYRVFRNWKKLRQLLLQFYNLKKQKNFLNEQMYKLYKTQVNISSHNSLEITPYIKQSQPKQLKQNIQIKPMNSTFSINKYNQQQFMRNCNSKKASIKLMEDSIERFDIQSYQEPSSVNQKIFSSQTLTQVKLQSISSQIQNNNSDLIFFKLKTNKEYKAQKERRKSLFQNQN